MSRELGGAWVPVAGRAAKVVRRPAAGQWCLFANGFSADTNLGKLCLIRESDAAIAAVLLEPLPTLAGSRAQALARHGRPPPSPQRGEAVHAGGRRDDR